MNMAGVYATELPGKKHKGLSPEGFKGLAFGILFLLLFIIFILVMVIAIEDRESLRTGCLGLKQLNSSDEQFLEDNLLNGNGANKQAQSTGAVTPSTAAVRKSTAAVTPSTAVPKSTAAQSTAVPQSTAANEQDMSTPTTIVVPQANIPREGGLQTTDDFVCDSFGCVIKAGQILQYAGDGLYDKCKDFIDYACAGWKMSHPLPDHKSEYNTMMRTEDQIMLVLKGLLESNKNSPDVDVKRASAFYHSCMNRSAIENYGLAGVQQLIGAWPILQPPWINGNMFQYDLTDSLETSIERGYSVFFKIYAGRNPGDVSQPMFLMEEPELGMKNKAFYLDPAFAHKLDSYIQLATEAAILLGANERQAATEIQDMVNFEIELAKILKSGMKGFPTEYRQLNVDDLIKLTTKIDGQKLLNHFISGADPANLMIGVLDYGFLTNLVNLIDNTSVRTLGNYVTWRFVLQNMDHLPRDFQSIYWWYEMTLHDTPSVPARWRKCLRETVDNFPYTTNRLHRSAGNRNYNSGSTSMVRNIFNNVKEIIRENVSYNQWMDAGSRQYALEKLSALKLVIRNDTTLKMDYSNINVTSEPFLYNLLRFRPQKTTVHLTLGSSPTSELDKATISLKVHYDYTTNAVVIPAETFYLPYFEPVSTKNVNYATVGTILAREIIKAISITGSNFDKSGNYAPWWSTETLNNYEDRMSCLGNRYSDITVTEINKKVNMGDTVTDLIMENMAVDIAFQAYKRWLSNQPNADQFLPSIEVDPEELFFLAYSQMNCGEIRREKYLDYIISAHTVPEPYRTNATLSQSSVFQETLGCPKPNQNRNTQNCALF